MIELHITDISKVVQQVLAPAFLLAGIGTFLTMMTQRLARIIDRAREVSFETDSADESSDLAALRDLLAIRAKLIQRAILCCTTAAIIICGLIGVMFIDALVDHPLERIIAVVFASAAGASTCTRAGAIEGQPTLELVEDLYEMSKKWYNFW